MLKSVERVRLIGISDLSYSLSVIETIQLIFGLHGEAAETFKCRKLVVSYFVLLENSVTNLLTVYENGALGLLEKERSRYNEHSRVYCKTPLSTSLDAHSYDFSTSVVHSTCEPCAYIRNGKGTSGFLCNFLSRMHLNQTVSHLSKALIIVLVIPESVYCDAYKVSPCFFTCCIFKNNLHSSLSKVFHSGF